MDKEIKKLRKKYAQRYRRINKKANKDGFEYFITNLYEIRDKMILDPSLSTLPIACTSILVAMELYEGYKNCVYKFYKPDSTGKLEHKPEYTEKEAAEFYSNEKKQYWSDFWALVSLDIAEWRKYNAEHSI